MPGSATLRSGDGAAEGEVIPYDASRRRRARFAGRLDGRPVEVVLVFTQGTAKGAQPLPFAPGWTVAVELNPAS